MSNKELAVHSEWRFTPICPGDKRPLLDEWQLNPLSLDEIPTVPTECNVGLLLGPVSGGVVAMDFDGEEAWQHWANTFDFDPPHTVSWTSGKELRQQMLYSVPQDMWDVLKKKVVNKLEFRWTGGQSVLPPSQLADGRSYTWINKPSETAIAPLPIECISHWVELMQRANVASTRIECTHGLSNYVMQRLNALGCVYRSNGKTVNLWHRLEGTKGGWYVYIENPMWVNHQGQKAMRVDEWIKQFWFQQGNVAAEYRKTIMNELRTIKG